MLRRSLAAVAILMFGAPLAIGQEEPETSVDLVFQPGTTRPESVQVEVLFEMPGASGAYVIQIAWDATVSDVDPTQGATIQATVRRVTGHLNRSGMANDQITVDTDQDPPVQGQGGPPDLFIYPRLVGGQFTYRVGPEGDVTVTNWGELVQQAATGQQMMSSVEGPFLQAGDIEEVLDRAYQSVPGGGGVARDQTWTREYEYRLVEDMRLATEDTFQYAGPGSATPASSGEGEAVEGLRIDIRGAQHLIGDTGGMPLEAEERDGVVILSPSGDAILLYREMNRFKIDTPPEMQGMTGSMDFGFRFMAGS